MAMPKPRVEPWSIGTVACQRIKEVNRRSHSCGGRTLIFDLAWRAALSNEPVGTHEVILERATVKLDRTAYDYWGRAF